MQDIQLGEGASIAGRYRIRSLLGRGGAAVVYRVQHIQLGTEHALKVLTVSSSSIRQRLLQEGRVQATLRHPNVLPVTDVVDLAGVPGLIMDYVAGPPLDVLLRTQAPAMELGLALARGIVRGVRAAHRRGLVHRDLKPANILLASSSLGLVPKVADFGLAKVVGAEDRSLARTRTGVAMGTPGYMSPEQLNDAKNVDARADVFALGAIVYELLSGVPAFPGDDLFEIFRAVRESPPEPLARCVPDVPTQVSDAVVRALAPDPEDRLPDCDALLIALGATTPLPAEDEAEPVAVDLGSVPPRPEEPPPADLVASLTEAMPPPPARHVVASTTPSRTWGTAAMVAGAGGVLLAVGAIAALVVVLIAVSAGALQGAAPVPVPVSAAPVPPVDLEPEPPPSDDAPAPPAADAAPEADEDAAAPASDEDPTAAKPAPPARRPASPRPAAQNGRLVLEGDVPRVYLVGEEGRFAEGPVPPGGYTVHAFFDDVEAMAAGRVTIVKGEKLTLRCERAMLSCRPK